MAGEQITRQGQGQVGDLLIGHGTRYPIEALEGFGLPSMRTSDRARALQHGEEAGHDYMSGRTMRASLHLIDTPTTSIGKLADDLAGALRPRTDSLVEFAYWRPGDDGPRLTFVRPRRLALNVDDMLWHHGAAPSVPVELFAPDPRWYALSESVATLEAPTAEDGRTYDRTYDMTYGGGSGGISTLTNAGNVPSLPTTRIDGPVTNPRIENVTTGEEIEVTIEIADGEFLLIDHAERTVKLGGTASRYGDIRGVPEWWALEPGANEVRFAAGVAGAGAQATVRWRSAWL